MRRVLSALFGTAIVGLLSWSVAFAGASAVPVADPASDALPIDWNQAYFNVIKTPDNAALEKGEILYDVQKTSSSSALAQSMGLINASPEACFKAVRDYNRYTSVMPYTVESRIIRSFKLTGVNAGADTVDFWTRLSVFGFETRYLLRIAHLEDAAAHRYRSLWTLVGNPEKLPGCVDTEKRACENDLAVNLGSHVFEPYKGDSKRTLHTYTLKLEGKSWVQRTALNIGGGSSMRDVTGRIRVAAEKR